MALPAEPLELEPEPAANMPDIPTLDALLDSELKLTKPMIKKAYDMSLDRVWKFCQQGNPGCYEESIHSVSEPRSYTSPEGTSCEVRLCLSRVNSEHTEDYDMVGMLVDIDGHLRRMPLLELGPQSVIARPHNHGGERRDGAQDLQSLLAALQSFDGIHVNINDLA